MSALDETGVLRSFGAYLDNTFNSNPYIVTGIIGLLSAVVDNVPLVADHESGGTLYDFTISDDKEKQIFLSDEVRDFAGGYTAGASRKGIR